MHRTLVLSSTLAVVATALVVSTPTAGATTAQCADRTSPDKVELAYETTSVALPAGTVVCYKAGTQVATVTIGDDGLLTSTLANRRGIAQAISYYVVVAEPPCCVLP